MPAHTCEQGSLLQDSETLFPSKGILFFFFFCQADKQSLWKPEKKEKKKKIERYSYLQSASYIMIKIIINDDFS